MSQFFIGVSAGSLPPSVPTSFITDSGTVVPAANIVNINGSSSSTNNNTGIQVIANPTGSNNELVQLTNRFQNTVTTTDSTPTTLSSFALGATPGVYTFDTNIAAFDLTDTLGTGFSIFTSIRTTGAAGTVCGTPDLIENAENATILPATSTLTVSGNNAIVQVTGIAGKTIHWNSITTYVFVS